MVTVGEGWGPLLGPFEWGSQEDLYKVSASKQVCVGLSSSRTRGVLDLMDVKRLLYTNKIYSNSS